MKKNKKVVEMYKKTKEDILLIEDNPDDIELTRRALKKQNIVNDIVVIRDGAEALDYLFHRGKYSDLEPERQPAVILLDLKLPKVDGIEILRRIKKNKQTKYIPVVILTSSREEQDIANGYKLGANSYVRKPVDFAQFSEAVRNLGMYWLLLNEPMPKGQ